MLVDSMTDHPFDVTAAIDESSLSSLQKLIIGICTGLVFLDGFDAQAIGYVAPALIGAWHVPPSRLGPVFSAGLAGLMLGALFIAPRADRFGRRPIILLSTMLFGAFTLATALASSIQSLLLLRFMTGLGLGGCMPNLISLTSEYSPRRHRALLVMLMFTGFTAGSLIAGLASARLISRYGWPAVFLVGGSLPLLAVPLVWAILPESIRYLVLRGQNPRATTALLRRLGLVAALSEERSYRIAADESGATSVRLLFRNGRGVSTCLLWLIFFMSLLDIYLLVNWLPTAITTGGATMQTAIFVGTMLQVGGLVGPIPLGWLFDRTGPRLPMVLAYLLAALCIACIGIFATTSIPLTMLVVFGAGFGVLGGQTAANAVAAANYPTQIRSTGVGWALGIGRVGSIIGPAVAGILIGRHVSLQSIFLLSAVPALLAAVAALGLAGGAFPIPKPDAIHIA
jgi:MFS transporter, AAHS family, 4-hydroxybenzoate transporter